MKPELVKAHNTAKVALMQKADSAFFTTICFSLKHEFTDSIRTACTNGLTIKFNPEFFMSLSTEERVFLMLHESMHVALMHVERFSMYKDGNAAKYNIAADHVINLMLIDRGYQMPKGGYADHIYQGMSTDEVYKLLPDDQEMEDMDLQEFDGDKDKFHEDVQDILVRAAVKSKMDNDKSGTIPGEIEIYLNKLLNPTLPWNRILQKYLFAKVKSDYTFKKPNKRFFPKHLLPSLYSEGLVNIAVAVDASGSVSDEEFMKFVTEINSIFKMLKPEKMTIIQFDTVIHSVDEVKSFSELRHIKFTGRGGTDVRCITNWAIEHKPTMLLVFTDGGFQLNAEPFANSIWLIHNNPKFTMNMGKTIHYVI